MTEFLTARAAASPDALAPDGSEVRLLTALQGGSFAHFTLPAGKISRAVVHSHVEEIWYFLTGGGMLWRSAGDQELLQAIQSGDCVAIPAGTKFQFRADWDTALQFVAITMPPWPGAQEAVAVEGMWPTG
jgi:mannose-6-phosphate isomerase-like protein (cupin superfamily)